jgi:hypothetical protein
MQVREVDGGRGGRTQRRGGTLTSVLALGLLAWAAACGSDAGEGSREARPSGLAGPDVPLVWSVEELYRSGGAEASAWAAFGEVTDVDFDSAGHLYVLDGAARRIAVVDTVGRLVRTVGSPGDGPGELRWAGGFVAHPDGAVTVIDPGHGGFVVYDPGGDFVGNVPVDPGDPGLPTGPLQRGPDGGIYGSGELRPVGADGDPAVSADRPVVSFPARAGVAPVVRYRGWRPHAPETRDLTEEETGGLRVRLPPVWAFHPELLVAPLPGGRLAVVDSFAYRVRVVDASGSVVGDLRRPIEPRPATEGLREGERARRLEAMNLSRPRGVVSNRSGGTAAAPGEAMMRLERARIDAMGFHPWIPVIARLGADPDGRLWVERTGPEPGQPGPTDILDPGGRYLGTLAPDGLRLPDAFGPKGLAAWVETDALGAALVRVGRIREGG